jgi:hypothetical protein
VRIAQKCVDAIGAVLLLHDRLPLVARATRACAMSRRATRRPTPASALARAHAP